MLDPGTIRLAETYHGLLPPNVDGSAFWDALKTGCDIGQWQRTSPLPVSQVDVVRTFTGDDNIDQCTPEAIGDKFFTSDVTHDVTICLSISPADSGKTSTHKGPETDSRPVTTLPGLFLDKMVERDVPLVLGMFDVQAGAARLGAVYDLLSPSVSSNELPVPMQVNLDRIKGWTHRGNHVHADARTLKTKFLLGDRSGTCNDLAGSFIRVVTIVSRSLGSLCLG